MSDDKHEPIVSLMHSIDGDRHVCCICFEWFTKDELEPVVDLPGQYWNVCKNCAADEKKLGASF